MSRQFSALAFAVASLFTLPAFSGNIFPECSTYPFAYVGDTAQSPTSNRQIQVLHELTAGAFILKQENARIWSIKNKSAEDSLGSFVQACRYEKRIFLYQKDSDARVTVNILTGDVKDQTGSTFATLDATLANGKLKDDITRRDGEYSFQPIVYGDPLLVSLTNEANDCGWPGCRVARQETVGDINSVYFDHGAGTPAQMVLQPATFEADRNACVKYGDRVVLAQGDYYPSTDAGYYGPRVLYGVQGGVARLDHGGWGQDKAPAFTKAPLVIWPARPGFDVVDFAKLARKDGQAWPKPAYFDTLINSCIRTGEQVYLSYYEDWAYTDNCGYLGCRAGVIVDRTLAFDHGGDDGPTKFYLLAPQP